MQTINLDNQVQLFHGAARLTQHAEGWHPSRMTEGLEKNYQSEEPPYAIRAACTAGIRLAFRTDASEARLSLRYKRSCRPLSQSDVFINNKLAQTFKPLPEDGACTAQISLPGNGLSSVEIYLPHCREVFIADFAISSSASIEPLPRNPTRWLALGDSITQGMTADSPSLTWTALAARRLNWDLHNLGVGGAVLQAELGSLALELPWDMATIAFGANDFRRNRSLDNLEQETRALLKTLLERPSAKIYLLTPIPQIKQGAPNNEGLFLEDYGQAMSRAAIGLERVQVLDGKTLVDESQDLFADETHPNNVGMAQFAERFVAQVTAEV